MDGADDFAAGHHIVELPAVRSPDVHEFDEPDDMPSSLEVAGHVDHGVIVDAALDHHVDLDRSEAGGGGGFDAFKDLRGREADIVHSHEDLVVE